MASKIVAPKSAFDLSEAITDKLLQAGAIVDLLGTACSNKDGDPPSDDSPRLASLAACELIRDAEAMAGRLFEITKQVRP